MTLAVLKVSAAELAVFQAQCCPDQPPLQPASPLDTARYPPPFYHDT
ncbi:unnamed protein product [Diplocarpon coronariae]